MKSNINLLVVGGCFPVQTNIPTENLYHFLLKEKIRNELSVKIEINILQYEKISPTFKRIKEVIEHKNICLLYTSPSPRDRTRSRMPSSA